MKTAAKRLLAGFFLLALSLAITPSIGHGARMEEKGMGREAPAYHRMLREALGMLKETMGIIKDMSHKPTEKDKKRLEEMMKRIDEIAKKHEEMMKEREKK